MNPPAARALEGGGRDGGDGVEEVGALELGEGGFAGGGADGGDTGFGEDAGLGAVGLVVGAGALEAGVIEAGGNGLAEFLEEKSGEIDGGIFEEEDGGFNERADDVGLRGDAGSGKGGVGGNDGGDGVGCDEDGAGQAGDFGEFGELAGHGADAKCLKSAVSQY